MRWIKAIEIAGFKQLKGKHEFGPGLTVVSGPNEAGKSALHAALISGLFGFSSGERRNSQHGSVRDNSAPWSGAPFKLALLLGDDVGHDVRLQWDFATDRVEIQDAVTGATLATEQPRQRDPYAVGQTYLSVGREEFEQLNALLQVGLEPVESSHQLRQGLQLAVEKAAVDDGGKDIADERLRKLLSEIGVHSGHYGATTTGMLSQVTRHVTELTLELENAHGVREQLEQIAAEQASVEAERERVVADITALTQERLRKTADRLSHSAEQARELHESQGGPLAQGPALADDLPGRVAVAAEACEGWSKAVATAETEARAVDLAPLSTERKAAQERVDEFSACEQIDTSAEPGVLEALGAARFAGADTSPPAEPEVRDPLLQWFRDHYDPARPARSRDTGGTRVIRIVAAAVIAVVALALGLLVSPAFFALLVFVALLGFVGPSGVMSSRDASRDFEGHSVDDLSRRAADEDRAWSEYRGALSTYEQNAKSARDGRVVSVERLMELVGPVFAGDGDPVERAAAYLEQCTAHRRWQQAVSDIATIEQQLAEARKPLDTLKTANESLTGAELELRRLLGRAGIDEPDLKVGLGRFNELAAADKTAREGSETRAKADARLNELLSGRTLEELEQDAADARQAVTQDERHNGRRHWEGSTSDGELAALQADASNKQARITELRTRQEERERVMGDAAAIEVDLAAAQTKLGLLERERDAVKVAREELSYAASDAYRGVAPHLNRALEAALPMITRGRYAEANVDEELWVRVKTPETGEFVDISLLSRGTQDQIALIERLELARILHPRGKRAPLLLDDCFAHTDKYRLKAAMQILAGEAQQRQIILFTDSDLVVDAAREAAPDSELIELPDPVDHA